MAVANIASLALHRLGALLPDAFWYAVHESIVTCTGPTAPAELALQLIFLSKPGYWLSGISCSGVALQFLVISFASASVNNVILDPSTLAIPLTSHVGILNFLAASTKAD